MEVYSHIHLHPRDRVSLLVIYREDDTRKLLSKLRKKSAEVFQKPPGFFRDLPLLYRYDLIRRPNKITKVLLLHNIYYIGYNTSDPNNYFLWV